jgi:hypothetical protein
VEKKNLGVAGLGGIGKTGLAEMVYRDEQVNRFFEKKVWVDVSNFDVQVIVRNIVQQLITTGYKGESFQQDLDLLHQI